VSEDYTIDAFIGDVKRILAEDGENHSAFERIQEKMQTLVKNPEYTEIDEEAEAGNIHSGRQSRPLYEDESGMILVRARFGPEAMTPIHSHGSWGVIGVLKGRDHYQVWQRTDEGDGPGEASVELIDDRILEPGDAVILPPPPQDIHAQQGHDGEATYEFVLFGKNAMQNPRLYFDPEAGHAELVHLNR
jgi:predicted metal-dependent enzyme (double-stranded beta helix superfamily)